jgi:integrase/recombinase XerD
MGKQVWVPVVSGPLAPYAAGFGSWLASQSYSPSAAAARLCQFDQLSRWLEREGLGVGELTGEQAERFAASRRAVGLVTWVAPQSVRLPLGYLRELGIAPMPAPALAHGPREELLAEYGRYLRVERRLSEKTVVSYAPAACLFLAGWEGSDGLGLERLRAADVSLFLARECPRRSVSGARDLVCALRSFLRFLHLVGLIDAPLVWAVPSVADLRDRTLPRGLEPGAVKKLLASCDRRRLVGRRDHAVLLLLSRLGLRAGEVAAIGLDDVDWRSGLLLVSGKGGRYDELPLPTVVSYCTSVDPVFGSGVDVARVRDALAAFLLDVRPELDPQPSAGAASGLQPAVADPVVDGAL